jgi:hypothetical protein
MPKKPALSHAPQDFTELRERLDQNLRNFLKTEVELGMTFARSAKYQKGRGNVEHYEISKRNALAALEAIDRFIVRLPEDLRRDIETRRPKLAQIISTL